MNKIKNHLDCLVFLVVTVGGVGKIKFAPGTFGSLAAIPLGIIYYLITIFFVFPKIKTEEQLGYFITFWPILCSFIIIIPLFIVGYVFCRIYLDGAKDLDPKEVVIDELVSQLLSFILCSYSLPLFIISAPITSSKIIWLLIIYIICPFILFRIFDILKPWPINWVDRKIKGAFGVMFDDIIAAILASIVHIALILIFIDIIK
ncbi:MAG: serine hydroxymethyltransferase [Rickettsiaceae bacterium]|jgi:phosphatidylglycerophosphatase A|nr:serine hydroxymethyltransferase [Rickettsiaceae bacterium]